MSSTRAHSSCDLRDSLQFGKKESQFNSPPIMEDPFLGEEDGGGGERGEGDGPLLLQLNGVVELESLNGGLHF